MIKQSLIPKIKIKYSLVALHCIYMVPSEPLLYKEKNLSMMKMKNGRKREQKKRGTGVGERKRKAEERKEEKRK